MVHSVRTAILSFKLPLSYDKLDAVALNSDYIKSNRFNHSAKFFSTQNSPAKKNMFFSPPSPFPRVDRLFCGTHLHIAQ